MRPRIKPTPQIIISALLILVSALTVIASGKITVGTWRAPDAYGKIIVEGTNGDDLLVVNAVDANSGSYSLNGGPAISFTGISSFTFNGYDGNDLMRINNPAGGLFAPTGGIFGNGGNQRGAPGDGFEILGGISTTALYTMGNTFDAGTVRHVHGQQTQVFQFTGMEPATDSVPEATFTVNGTAGPNVITLDNGTSPADGLVRISIDGFEPIEFSNKTNVIINGLGGSDTFLIGVTEKPTGLASLTVNTGNDVGDTINLSTMFLTGTAIRLNNTAGPINDTNGMGANIRGASLAMDAGTGIATSDNPLSIEVASVEAKTVTGGISLINVAFLPVQVGGVTADLPGLNVVTSGDVRLTSFGSITLADTDGPDIVKSGSTSGDVTLVATFGSANIVATVDRDAVTAPRGSIFMQASGDISLGLGGTDFDNDVRASGNVTLIAFRDVLVDGFSDVSSDDFGQGTGGDLIVTATRNISVTQTTGDDASMGANGNASGDVILTTGADGLLNLDADAPSIVFSNTGDVTINADRFNLGAGSTIDVNLGVVTISPVSASRVIDLGSATDVQANTLEISDTEFDRIDTPSLVIGSPAQTGNTRVTAPISPAFATSLTLSTRGYVYGAGGSITETTFRLTDNSIIGKEFGLTSTTFTHDSGTGPIGYTATNFIFDGGGASDLFNVESTILTTNYQLNGGAGGDSFRIGHPVNTLDNIAGPVTVNGGESVNIIEDEDYLFILDVADASPNIYNINQTTVSRSGAANITYDGTVEQLIVSAGNNSDTFNVDASPNTTYTLDGNDPNTPPGDRLIYNNQGRPADRVPPAGSSGTIVSPTVRDVIFSDIETVTITHVPTPLEQAWTTTGDAGVTEDESNPARPTYTNFTAAANAGSPAGTYVLRYNMQAVQGLTGAGANTRFRVRFRDDGPGSRVTVAIVRSPIAGGGSVTLGTLFDSDAYAPSLSFQSQEILMPALAFDFTQNLYWLEVTLTKADAANQPAFGSAQVNQQ